MAAYTPDRKLSPNKGTEYPINTPAIGYRYPREYLLSSREVAESEAT